MTVRVATCVVVVGWISIVIDKVWIPLTPALSIGCTVKKYVAAAFGVPEITPLLGLSVNPLGSEPLDSDHVYVPVPPEACSV